DSIVVIENIKRHLLLQSSRSRAIVDAVREVAGAITASTLTTVIVFLPLAFVSDITGGLFRPFALTVSIALASSLIVALTIVPVLASWLLRAPEQVEATAAAEPVAGAAQQEAVHEAAEPRDRLRRGYRPILLATLRRPWLVLVGAVVILAASGAALPLMATNFLGDD
ncbi:efflux RND transporter permease subunit, partial [Escherichia coli]|uniref:efflux RND transporter permease subunit n=1 Tax=Escherichia coli TaxID=562 RepID=UPI0011CACF14